jgi:hypothetical protein
MNEIKTECNNNKNNNNNNNNNKNFLLIFSFFSYPNLNNLVKTNIKTYDLH